MDLLVVCSLGVLINVVCPTTYHAPGMDRHSKMNNAQLDLWNRYDVNGISEDERKLFCLTRAQSIEIVSWLCITYASGIPDMPIQKLFSVVLVNICRMLCNYKWQADRKKIVSSPDFTIGRLKVQIHAALAWAIQQLDPSLSVFDHNWQPKSWRFPMADSTNILPSNPPLNIHKSSATLYKHKSLSELFTLGETELDQKFARRLEVKREIMGLFYNDIAHEVHPEKLFFRYRNPPGETTVNNQGICALCYCKYQRTNTFIFSFRRERARSR